MITNTIKYENKLCTIFGFKAVMLLFLNKFTRERFPKYRRFDLLLVFLGPVVVRVITMKKRGFK
jgi:hypothetical protein